MDQVDAIVIGAGAVGLAVARSLALAGCETLVLEQHDLIGSETSARNSEVIHAGIYYPEHSQKAALCVRGKWLLYEFCQSHHVPHSNCGKLIVATEPEQKNVLAGYIEQAGANGVDDLYWLDQEEIHELEPEIEACAGVMSPSTGIIDSHAYMLALQGELEAQGGMVVLNTPVRSIRPGREHTVETDDMSLRCRLLVNSAGHGAPFFARDLKPTPNGYFAKGHYYAYAGTAPFGRLIYPVAQAGGLGVHVTLDLGGQARFGPDVHWVDRLDYSFDESIYPDFVAAIKRYYPGLDETRLHPGYTGIRPKLAPDGSTFSDFQLIGPQQHGVSGLMHLLGIESPGLTASLAIAEEVQQALLS